jgi:hypothetical protein
MLVSNEKGDGIALGKALGSKQTLYGRGNYIRVRFQCQIFHIAITMHRPFQRS